MTTSPRPIQEVAGELGLEQPDLRLFGRDAAKVELGALRRKETERGRLVLVSSITPTRTGEGKTTVAVGLSMGLRLLGRRTAVCLREPSLGPVFGIKGGGTGGGRAQVVPAQPINLHFTGDLHAVTSAHNLLAALVDNELYFGTGRLDPRRVGWRRVLDMNDRALRQVIVGLGGRSGGAPRETGFDITAASEVLSLLSLTSSRADLQDRLARIVVGQGPDKRFVTAGELGADGAMTALLLDALLPNLVQTSEGGPALVHGGSFANVSHGCSSLLATRLALRYADDVITEAGFGFDMGGENFLHIKCRAGGLWPHCVILVATLRALRVHGGARRAAASTPDPAALRRGLANLERHVSSVRAFGLRPLVAINLFPGDPEQELRITEDRCADLQIPSARFGGFSGGGEGSLDLARSVATILDAGGPVEPRALYDLSDSYPGKLQAIAQGVYGAGEVKIEPQARRDLDRFSEAGYDRLPVCIAKTAESLTDSPRVRGGPSGFSLTVREVRLAAGAGYVVALMGNVQTMPGLPRSPAARRVEVDPSGHVSGIMQGE